MSAKYVIQGRRVQGQGRARRDEVRLDETGTETEARHAAQAWRDEGFTTWIFRVHPGPNTAPEYRLVDTLRPIPTATTSRRGA